MLRRALRIRGERASVKEFVTTRNVPGRPTFSGKNLPGYLVSYGRHPETSKDNLYPSNR